MPDKNIREYFRDKGLLPFHADFADDFLTSGVPHHCELVAPAGSGKRRFACHLMEYHLDTVGAKRILVLVPRPLLMQWKMELGVISDNVDVVTVDRHVLLEFEANARGGDCIWPLSIVALMDINFAGRVNISESITLAEWDLVVVDQSHYLAVAHRTLLTKLVASSRVARMLLLADKEAPLSLPGVSRHIIEREKVLDWNNRNLFPAAKRESLWLTYNRTEDEQAFLHQLRELCVNAKRIGVLNEIQTSFLLRRADSCMLVLEGALHNLYERWRYARNSVAHGLTIQKTNLGVEDDTEQVTMPEGDISVNSENAVDLTCEFLSIYNELEKLMQSVDEIPKDAKVDVLLQRIDTLRRNASKPFICIWTSFAQTAQYLSAVLEQRDIRNYCLTGETSIEDGQKMLKSFREDDGILILTDVHKGMALEFVDECINYDLPWNPEDVEQRWNSFIRLGRTTPFRMSFLRDQEQNLLLDGIEKKSELLKDVFGQNI